MAFSYSSVADQGLFLEVPPVCSSARSKLYSTECPSKVAHLKSLTVCPICYWTTSPARGPARCRLLTACSSLSRGSPPLRPSGHSPSHETQLCLARTMIGLLLLNNNLHKLIYHSNTGNEIQRHLLHTLYISSANTVYTIHSTVNLSREYTHERLETCLLSFTRES